MAITRAQQVRQMLKNGSMKKIKGQDHMLAYITPGEAKTLEKLGGQKTMTKEGILAYPPGGGDGPMGGGGDKSGNQSGGGQGPAGGASAGGNYGGSRNPEQTYGGSIFGGGGGGPKGPPSVLNKPKAKPKSKPKVETKSKPSFFDSVKSFFSKGILGRTLTGLSNSKLAQLNNAFQREQYLENLAETDPKAYAEVMGDLRAMGYADTTTKPGTKTTFTDLGEDQAKAILEGGRVDTESPTGLSTDYSDYQQKQMSKFTPEGGPEGNNSGISQILPLTTSLNPTTTTSTTPSTRNFGGLAPRFAGSIFDFTGMAEGGRAGFQTGGSTGVSMQNTLAQNIAANNAQAAANQKARGAISALLSSKTSQTSPATTTSSGVPAAIAQATPTTQTLQQAAQQVSPQMASAPGLVNLGVQQKLFPYGRQGPSSYTVSTPTGPATMSNPGFFGGFGAPVLSRTSNSYTIPANPNVPYTPGDPTQTIKGPFDKYGIPTNFKPSGPEGVVGNFGPGGMPGVILSGRFFPSEQAAIESLGISKYNTMMADGGRAGYMDGGMIEDEYPMGGIMDLESIRDEYFVGGLVKSAKKAVKGVTRAVKKVAKSPIGKLALGYALTGGLSNMAAGRSFGANFFSPSSFISKGGIRNIFSKQGLSNIAFGAPKVIGPPNIARLGSSGLLGSGGKFSIGKGLTLGLGIPAALDYFGVGKEKKEEDDFDVDEYYRTQGIDIDAIRNSPYYYMAPSIAGGRFEQADGGRTGYQEGGDAEPVAKKTMPLLDMNGQEKDYRETGGFVDMGRMERADDVPARLSKNEFVFTADAVRNAGEGDVDKGAEVMYNMMKNLESGGEVSEESQGLDGAREMFQTSKRLEEVL